MNGALLEINDLSVHFPVGGAMFKRRGIVRAVDEVDVRLREGEVLGLVGESGCGKSTLARAVVRLVKPTRGHILFEGVDIAALSRRELRRVRSQIQMIFQDPYASLNPRMTVFDALAEPLAVHGRAARKDMPKAVSSLMERVGLAPRFMRKYPHEFSGGQRQRIAIARALALEPRLIIADEPVSALDVSVQAQIINLIADLCKQSKLSLIFISHDLSVVRHLADRIAVMYLGKIVEIGSNEEIFNAPRHPYTRALLSAIPLPDPERERRRERLLIEGDLPSPLHPPGGCPFHPRCPYADDTCRITRPAIDTLSDSHDAACIKVEETLVGNPKPML